MQNEVASLHPHDDALFAQIQQVIIGSNRQAAVAALQTAHDEGYHTLLLTTSVQGEARQVGQLLGGILRELAMSGGGGGIIPVPLPRPACVILGGETTVTLGQHPIGMGGRNQELALAAVRELDGLDQVALVTLATDGNDGPTDAAGAVVTGTTLARATHLGLDLNTSLAHHDAYRFFAALGDLLQPGMTQTNVNDLIFLFTF
jgi:hydroxypyruvate reductase